jgi:hypothetical protein
MGTTAYVLELRLVFMPRKLHEHENINTIVPGVCDFLVFRRFSSWITSIRPSSPSDVIASLV